MKATLIMLMIINSVIQGWAIFPDQVDTFDSKLLESWAGANPDIRTNGPGGEIDKFLLIASNGSGSSGGKLGARNLDQWSGNYFAAGVLRLTFQARNFSSKDLFLRAVLKTGPGRSAGFASSIPYLLAPTGTWQRVVLDLSEGSLKRVNSSTLTYSELITNVVELRILHSAHPSISGDIIEASLGLDDIQGLHAADPKLNISVISGQAQVWWNTAGSRGYILESTPSLGIPEWEIESSWEPEVGIVKSLWFPTQQNEKRFFRLRLP
jgi:hypothetical protein